MSRVTLDLADCMILLERFAEADQLLARLQLDFPELANGSKNYSQRFRDLERELATARPSGGGTTATAIPAATER